MTDKLSREIAESVHKNNERIKKETEEYFRKKAEENGQTPLPQDNRSWEEKMYVDSDKPGTIDNGTATIWYIIIMVVGAIFKDRLMLWVMATFIWWRHITRKSRRQKEWDKKHNGGKK